MCNSEWVEQVRDTIEIVHEDVVILQIMDTSYYHIMAPKTRLRDMCEEIWTKVDNNQPIWGRAWLGRSLHRRGQNVT